MKDLRHRGYIGIITEIDFKTAVIHGEVLLTKDVVTFQANSVKDLVKEFKASVEDYLNFCKRGRNGAKKPLNVS